ncbi:unnamed protein product [Fraxinus pennsylvanica]|uniref:Bulb-type lectin domain-containing protein n=1 Tax=Fraxinus pennsylvanica TaxID=56036 RepID=A0AAD2DU57_9LAMI|nr:unnamed protein product [Fraxinus pennsylvanica]
MLPLPSNAFTLLLLSLLATFAAVLAADIPLGSTLYASDPNSKWTSPNGTTLSFITDSVHPGGATALYAAITFNSIPIWKAGGSSASVNSSAVFRLVASGDLQLLPSSTSATPVWSSGTANLSVTAVSLEDSGNLILKNASGSAVWTSFDHPTDVIVPNQSFFVRHTLSSGLYSFKLQKNGNLTLWWNNSVEYYNSGLNSTMNSNLSNPVLDIRSTGILTLSDPTLSNSLDLAYSSDYAEEGNIFRFLKLDNDGNLRIYSYTSGSGNRIERWAAVDDQCQVYGFCGNMGICGYNDSNPICGCPSDNFELVDKRDSRKGCKRKVELLDCPGSETMLQLDHSMFLTYPPELSTQIFYIAISACKLNCLVGSCKGSTSLSDGSGQCYLKSSDFISGYHSPAIPSTSFMKVCGPVVPTPSTDGTGGRKRNGWRLSAWLVVVVVVVTVLVLVVVEGSLWWWCVRNSSKFGGFSGHYALLEYASGAPVQFAYKELQKATKGFKEKLGAGGFGAVYRGVLANRMVAAVKQLEGIEQVWAYEEFEKGNFYAIVDKRLPRNEIDMEQLIRAILVSFWCIQEQPSQRPMMGKVVQMLEGITEIDKPPAPKAATEGSVGGTSLYASSSISALSTIAASVPAPSSSSSLQTAGILSSASGKHVNRESSSLLRSDTK